MIEDTLTDGLQATTLITPTAFDKRGLMTNDVKSLGQSLQNLHHIAIHFPIRLTHILQANGNMELLIRKTKMLALMTDLKAEIAFSAAIACIASSAACGNASLRVRILQANLIPVLIPHLYAATTIVERNRQRLDGVINGREAALMNDQLEVATRSSGEWREREEGDMEVIRECHYTSGEINERFISSGSNTPVRRRVSPEERPSSSSSPTRRFRQLSSSTSSSFFDDYEGDEDQATCRAVKVHDLIQITKLIAFLSKYENTRTLMRERYPLFYLIEHLTDEKVTIDEIQRWAGTCMRNAVRNSGGSLESKTCGLISCTSRHNEANSFYCQHGCSVSYCSLECLEFAWLLHSNWCSSRSNNDS